jgi:hypothetical protein
MSGSKSTVSRAESYRQIGEFWDAHDLTDFWEQTKPAEFEVDIGAELSYFPVERGLSARVRKLAQERGVSAETLVNLWLQEKVAEAAK